MGQVPTGCACGESPGDQDFPLVGCDGAEGTAAISAHICNTEPIDVNIADADITVNVDVGPSVEVSNDAGNPIPVSGTVTITDGAGPVTVDGTVAISNSSIEISNDVGNPVPVNGTVTITDGSGPVTVDGTVAVASNKLEDAPHVTGDTGNFVLGVRNDAAASLTSADLDYTPLSTDAAGRVGITDLGGSITVDGTLTVGTATSGGLSMYRNLDVNATGSVIKGSAGQIYYLMISNIPTTEAYVKLYNKASAPTSADTPVMTIPMKRDDFYPVEIVPGSEFSLGIGIRATTALADANNASPAVNTIVVNIGYK